MSTASLRNDPKQDRALLRVESIKAAAREHYAAVGRDYFNTADVAKIAGCAIGTVYRYFEDRVVLLDAIEPERDSMTKLRQVRDILTRELPMVTGSREKDCKALMDEAIRLIDA